MKFITMAITTGTFQTFDSESPIFKFVELSLKKEIIAVYLHVEVDLIITKHYDHWSGNYEFDADYNLIQINECEVEFLDEIFEIIDVDKLKLLQLLEESEDDGGLCESAYENLCYETHFENESELENNNDN